MHRISHFWERLRSSLWFLPTLIVLGAMALAVALVEAGTHIDSRAWEAWPLVFGTGAAGARDMLGAVAASMITVAGVAFSVTVVALSLASSQYSSRVLRNFMSDRANQAVLGIFVGIIAYCLVVLRTIRGGDEGAFVPPLAVLGGVALAFVGVGCLIFFVHHIASSIQASHILAAVSLETTRAIDRLFPQTLAQGESDPEETHPPLGATGPWHPVPATATGYLQGVDEQALLRFARDHKVVVRMERGIGEFVIDGAALACVTGSVPGSAAARELNRAYAIGRQRTITQDATFGVQLIVDVALKALSPGVNDTTTAVMCVDRLTQVLVRLARRRGESPFRREGGELRVIARGPTFASMLEDAFDPVRRNAEGNVTVFRRLAGALREVGSHTENGGRRQAVLRQAAALADAVMRSITAPDDRDRLVGEVEELSRTLDPPAVSAPAPCEWHEYSA